MRRTASPAAEGVLPSADGEMAGDLANGIDWPYDSSLPSMGQDQGLEASMQNVVWRPLIGLAVLMSCCVGAAWAQDDDDVYGEKLLPPQTLFMFSIPDVPDLVTQVNESSLGQLLADPDMQPFLDEVRGKVGEVSSQVQEKLGVTLEDLQNLLQGEFTLAVVEQPARKLNAVLMVDYGENAKTVETLLGKLDASLTESGATLKQQSIADVEIKAFEFPKSDDMPYNTVAYFTADGYLVLASDVAPLKSVLDRWEGEKKETLAASDSYKYIMEKCATDGEEPLVKWFVDPIGLVKSGVSMVQGQNPQAGLVLGMLPILGLDKFHGMGGGMDLGVGGYDSVSKAFIHVEQPPTGVLAVFQFPAIAQLPPAWVPDDATMYLAMNWDVNEGYLAVESIADSFQGPGSLGKILDALSMDESGPQFHIKKDILDNLTGEMNFVTYPLGEVEEDAEEPVVPTFAVTAGLKDAAAIKDILEQASKKEDFPGRATEVDGAAVYELPMDGGQTVLVTVAGKVLLVTNNEDVVSDVIAGKTESPLAASDDYKSIAKYFPSKTSIVSFQQQDEQAATYYNMLKKQSAEDFGGIDFSKLPEYETILKYVTANGSYAVPDEKGALFVGFSIEE